ncbi:MAG: DinB family protein [Bacteroidota bacterium]
MISKSLIDQFNHRIYGESIPRIEKVVSILTHDQIWYSPNTASNSIGHLILHLCGNVTQWIGTGIGQRVDDRERDLEFTTADTISAEGLVDRLQLLRVVTDEALKELTDELLLEPREVQGFNENPLSILVHVIEHFSYHTGQIAMIAKYRTDSDLGFYEGQNLNVLSPT